MRRRPILPARPAAWTGGALAVGVGGLYAAGLFFGGGEIDAGTTIGGVEVGGLTRAEAVRTVEQQLSAPASRPLVVRVGDRDAMVDPRRAGLSFDVPRSVDQVARSGADPVAVIGGLFRSGRRVEPVVRVDEDEARDALTALAGSLDRTVRDGAVVFDGGRAREVPARTGYALDVDAAVAPLTDAFPAEKAGPVTVLPSRRTDPKVTAQETRRAMGEFARPAMSAPVTLTLAGERVTITPAVVGAHLEMRPDAAGRLVPRLDGKGLLAAPEVARPVSALTGPPENAVLRLDGERVVVAADGKVGRRVTPGALSGAVLPLLTRSGADARTGELPARVTRPAVTRENASELGLKEEMSSFTVGFERAEYRTKNIGRAAELIDGSVVLPGETWSLNRTVGERTEANGFTEGVIILDDKYAKAAGGGVSTVATTVFNAMFFAGLEPVEYGAHSFYIERYPEGREATVAWGHLDLRFRNDSGHAMAIRAKATDTSVTVTFLGTKKYDEVKAVKGPRTRVQQPAKKVSADEACVPQTPLEGFDVTVDRVFVQDGREVRREPFHTRYTPRDEVVCQATEDRTAPDGREPAAQDR
ncbi:MULTISPECIES: VanW family protein [Streptomyces]|uniref:VanW family protein n=2 Tax=Streptomyces TaxID=1883 RepID=A0ABY5NE25_9ACTN|nr:MULTISPECIES: VanW family protein [Streptomyces]KUH40203.1 hypothetical protein ATE80_02545 [Streptomyces kanasensis]UUS34186.1 VanW family protein [Streptomyces changanensis]